MYIKGFLQMAENLGFKGPLEVSSPPEKTSLLSQDLVQAVSEYLRDDSSSLQLSQGCTTFQRRELNAGKI